nr:hypothetical protein [Tanacetum cinerariifolium]
MGYKNSNTTPEMKSDEIIKSGVEELVPILSECEVTLEDKRECDVPISKNSPIFYDHSDIFSDFKIDDDISVYNDDFEDIEYVKASLPNPKIVSVEEENVVHQAENDVNQEEEEVDLEDIFQIQDIVLHEKLLSITRLISNIESLNDNPIPDRVLNSFKSDNSLSGTFSLEFETFCDHMEETRSGSTTHADNSFLEYDSFALRLSPIRREELLIDDSILSHESSDSNLEDNPSLSQPPSKLPDAKFDAELDFGEEISDVRNTIDELECLDPKAEFDNDDYSSFTFTKVFSFLSAESEDTIFDPGFTPVIEVFLCWIFVPVHKIFTSFLGN